MNSVHVASAIAIAALMLLTWGASIPLRNASIVDIVWGLGFVVVVWVSAATADTWSTRSWLLGVLITVWGVRLSTYLARRNHGHGEDFRYRAMRRKWGRRFAVTSLVTVFVVQGVAMFVVSLPAQVGHESPQRALGWLAALGVAVYAVGLFFEAVGDWQLARFRGDQANAGQVMDRGLWRYTRHPNYFGDACVWWGVWLVAADSGHAGWTVIGPIVMTTLLVNVSGAALLEKSLSSRKPGFAEYVSRTSRFVPLPPKSHRRS